MSESSRDEAKDEPKLSVDEDWKEAVQREKEQAAQQQQAQQQQAQQQQGAAPEEVHSEGDEPSASGKQQASAAAPPDAGGEEAAANPSAGATAAVAGEVGGTDAENQLPPASFDLLVTTLATQALMALGQLPGPEGKLGQVEKPIAKHYIDMLVVLEEKTAGNIDSGEQKLLAEVLHNLRMTFVAVR